jgi:hypothetical protein
MMSGLSDAQSLQIFGGLFVETRKASQQLGELTTNFTSVMEALDRDLGAVSRSIAEQNLADQLSRVGTEFRILGRKDGTGRTLAEHTLELSTAFGEMAIELTREREGLIAGITATTSKFSEFVTDPSVAKFFEVFNSGYFYEQRSPEMQELVDRSKELDKIIKQGSQNFQPNEEEIRARAEQKEIQRQINALKQSKAQENKEPGNRTGGIVSGPDTGYRALLHGTEAVVPLPDGKNIPVTLDTSKFDASITALLDGIPKSDPSASDRLAQLMEQGIELNSEILDTLKQGNKTSNRMVRVMS